MDGVHCLIEAVLAFHQLAASTADTGQAAQEPGVDGLIDAHGVHPHPLQVRREFTQQLVLVADLPVGDEDDDRVAPLLPATS